MKMRIILWGNIKVSDGYQFVGDETHAFYQKIEGAFVKVYCVQSEAEIQLLLQGERGRDYQWILCGQDQQKLKSLSQTIPFKVLQSIYYVPYMMQVKGESLLRHIVHMQQVGALDRRVEKISILLLGKGKDLGQILVELLKQLHFVQQGKYFRLYLDLPVPISLQEVSEVEDVLREYLSMKSKLIIETVKCHNPKQEYGYAFKIEA